MARAKGYNGEIRFDFSALHEEMERARQKTNPFGFGSAWIYDDPLGDQLRAQGYAEPSADERRKSREEERERRELQRARSRWSQLVRRWGRRRVEARALELFRPMMDKRLITEAVKRSGRPLELLLQVVDIDGRTITP